MFQSLENFEVHGIMYRFLKPSDKSFFIDLYTNKEVMKYVSTSYTNGEAESFFEKLISKKVNVDLNSYIWVAEIDDNRIGLVGLTKVEGLWDIGAVLASHHLGQGLGTRIMSNILSKVFNEFSLDKITGTIPDRNKPCIMSVEKIGFEFLGKYRGVSQVWLLERDNFKNGNKE